jgi:hypothetical protein
MPSLLDKVKNKLGLKKAPPGQRLGGSAEHAGQEQQHQRAGGAAQSKSKVQKHMSDGEKEARRDAMAAAAANRGQAWDKKVSKGAQARRQEQKRQEQQQQGGLEDEPYSIQSEETLKTVQEAKRQEQQLAEVRALHSFIHSVIQSFLVLYCTKLHCTALHVVLSVSSMNMLI